MDYLTVGSMILNLVFAILVMYLGNLRSVLKETIEVLEALVDFVREFEKAVQDDAITREELKLLIDKKDEFLREVDDLIKAVSSLFRK